MYLVFWKFWHLGQKSREFIHRNDWRIEVSQGVVIKRKKKNKMRNLLVLCGECVISK